MKLAVGYSTPLVKSVCYSDEDAIRGIMQLHNWALEYGFYAKDLFILVATGGRISNPELTQRHARKYHSYWWVFV
jgi:hypothetical protein